MKSFLILALLLTPAGVSFLGAQTSGAGASPVLRLDPALDAIVSSDAKVEKLADGFGFVEGPVWVRRGGYLLFSDIPANKILKWNPADGKVSTFLGPSGYTGNMATVDRDGVGAISEYGTGPLVMLGSNGITVDPQGRVLFATHGDRSVVRLENDNKRTVLADRWEGKRLGSPNDLTVKSNGTVYFSDMTVGLRQRDADPKREIPFTGLYMVKDGKVALLTKEVSPPNGVALSPDEKLLYVAGRISESPVLMRFQIQPDDTLVNGEVFFKFTNPSNLEGGPDGMKVDSKGNVYSTGPGGIWVISPEGKHLGTLRFPEVAVNFAFGNADGKVIYVCARHGLYRLSALKVAGRIP